MSTTELFVGNLPFSSTDDELAAIFSSFGMNTAHVMKSSSGKSRGFGIVDFKSAAAASLAIQQCDGTLYGDRTLTVRNNLPISDRPRRVQESREVEAVEDIGIHKKKFDNAKDLKRPTDAERMPNSSLFVSNLSFNTTDAALYQHICAAGLSPVEVKIATSNKGRSPRPKGWGVASFMTIEEATIALGKVDQSELDGRKLFVRFDISPRN